MKRLPNCLFKRKAYMNDPATKIIIAFVPTLFSLCCGKIKDDINAVPIAITTENAVTIKTNENVEKFNNNCWVNGILLLRFFHDRIFPSLRNYVREMW